MLVGILADSHDNLDALDAALKVLRERDVAAVLHAGDVISPFAAARFSGLTVPLWAVYGNNDGERRLLRERFSELGCVIDDFVDFELEGLRFALYHGTFEGVLAALLRSGKYDVVVSGHSHHKSAVKVGGTLSINPGELCGYLTGERSLCLLDLGSMDYEFLCF